MKERVVLILGGGDWNDASVENLIVPKDMDLDEQKRNWNDWYKNHYIPEFRDKKQPEYKSFTDWLIERGCKKAELEEFYD